MLTVHVMWAGNRQPPYGQNCGTLKDDTSCMMIVLTFMFTSKALFCISSHWSSMIQATPLPIRSSVTMIYAAENLL